MGFNWDLRVPYQYSNRYITLRELHDIMLKTYHPEYVRRFIAWLHYKNGNVGAGGLSRTEQPDLPGFAPSLQQSFHWAGQVYNDGKYGACAVDTVFKDGPDPGDAHDGIPWSEVPIQGSAEAKRWGIHANVGVPGNGESWHIQAIEIDGHASWVAAGRPAPVANYPIPPEHNPYIFTVIGPSSGAEMKVLNTPIRIYDTRPYGWLPAGEHVVNTTQGNVEAVMVTMTVVPLGGKPGFATLWGDGPRPNASVINWGGGTDAVANTTVVRVVGGNFRLFTSTEANVIFDVQSVQ